MSTSTFRKSPLFRFVALTVLTAFVGLLPAQPSYAQVAIVMPPPGQMIHITNPFEPPQMIGLKIDLKDPFSFDFIMDQGQNPMTTDVKKEEYNKIIKYFLVSLAMPNKDMWVNLSPYESQRIIPEIFAQTEMGRDLLAQDYILKQFTASLMYPEDGLGKKFWDKVYAEAQARFGTTEINVNTFNKVWIVADHADVYQKDDTAFLIRSHLKVMLEQDYKAIEKNKEMFGSVQAVNTDETMDAKTKMASDLVRQIIIPAIEKEVNEGQSFAAVRQVYNAEIMATWFKKTLRESLLGQVFANKSKIAGQKVSDPQAMEKIYHQYLRAYKKGVFNYIREDATPDGQTIPRKYFSGGLILPYSRVQSFTQSAMQTLPTEQRQAVQQELFTFENRTADEVAKTNIDSVSTGFSAIKTGLLGAGVAAVMAFSTPGAQAKGVDTTKPQPAPAAVQSTNAPVAVTNGIPAGVHGNFTVVGDNLSVVYPSTNSNLGTVYGSQNGVNYVYGTGNHESFYWNPGTNGVTGNWVPVDHPQRHVTLVEDKKTGKISESHTLPMYTERLAKDGIHNIVTGTYATSQSNISIGFVGDGEHLLYDTGKTGFGVGELALVPVVGAAEGSSFVLYEGAVGTYEGGKYVYKGGKAVGEYSWDGVKYVSKETKQGVQIVFNKKTGQFVVRAADREGNALLDEGKSVVNAGILGPINTVIAPFNAHIQFLRTQDNDLRGQVKSLTDQTATYRTQISSLQTQIQQTGDANGALTSQLNGIQGKLAQAVDHIGTLEQQLKQNALDYQDSLNKANQAVKDSEAKRIASEQDAAKKADALRGQIKDKDDQIGKLGTENTTQRQTLETQRQDLAKQLTEINTLKTNLTSLGSTNADLTTKLSAAQDQLNVSITANNTLQETNVKLQAASDRNADLNKVLLAALGVTAVGAFWMFMKGRNAKKEAAAARAAKDASDLEVAKLKKAAEDQKIEAQKQKAEFERQIGEIQKGFGELQANHTTLTQQFGALQTAAQEEKTLRLAAEERARLAEEALAAALKAPAAGSTPASATSNAAPAVDLLKKATDQIAVFEQQLASIPSIVKAAQDDAANPVNAGIPEKQDWTTGKGIKALDLLGQGQVKEYGQVTDEQVRPAAQRIFEERTGQVSGVAFVSHEQALNDAAKKLEDELKAKLAALNEYKDHLGVVNGLNQQVQTRTQKMQEEIAKVNVDQEAGKIFSLRTGDWDQQQANVAARIKEVSGSNADLLPAVQKAFAAAKQAETNGDAQAFPNLDKEMANMIVSEIQNKYSTGQEADQLKQQLEQAQARQAALEQNAVVKAVKDKAQSAVGGINLSDENLTINIKVDGAGMPLPAQFQDRAMMNINGLTSIIRKITPMTSESLPALYALVQ